MSYAVRLVRFGGTPGGSHASQEGLSGGGQNSFDWLIKLDFFISTDYLQSITSSNRTTMFCLELFSIIIRRFNRKGRTCGA